MQLRVLLVEVSDEDARRIEQELERGDYRLESRRAGSLGELERALHQQPWDLMVAGHPHSAASAPEARTLLRERGFNIPLIVISGDRGVESAVAALKAGARDYLLKDNLGRLLSTVERELRESREWRARREAEEALRRRDAILEAVGYTAEQLLLAEDCEDGVRGALESLGRATGVTGVHLVECRVAANGEREAWLNCEWRAGARTGEASGAPRRLLAWHAAGLESVERLLALGQVVNGPITMFPAASRELFRDPAIESVIFLPVMATNGWWGFLGFSDRTPDRTWTAGETEALKAAAAIVGASIRRLRGEAALRESEARYRRLAENAPDVIYRFRLRPTPELEYVSPAVFALSGFTPEQHLRNPQLARRHLDPEDWKLIQRVLKTPASIPSPLLLRWHHPDGSIRWTEHRLVPVLDEAGQLTAMEGIARDVTDGKRLEEQLRQSQKLDAVGRLAGGVAHDFNNMLAVINGYAELALLRTDLPEMAQRSIEEIRKAGERAASLTRQLLLFSRREVPQQQVLDLNTVVVNMERMLRRLIGEDIRLSTRLGDSLHLVRADPGQMEQVLMNLAVNARDAMPMGGELVIETRPLELTDTSARQYPGLTPGSYTTLAVCDTGCGIDPETLTHIFEPFFTTKETGAGTGLGLSVVYGIVQQSGGAIHVDSVPGKGSVFTLLLPGASAQLAEEVVAVPKDVGETGWETILLVEDERAVRSLVREVLQGGGYKVYEAASAREALAFSERYDEEIHLLITDVIMPDMSGPELYDWLANRRPSTAVVYMSGYTDDMVARHGLLNQRVPLIHKPFTAEKLFATVREQLKEAKRLPKRETERSAAGRNPG